MKEPIIAADGKAFFCYGGSDSKWIILHLKEGYADIMSLFGKHLQF